MKFFFIRIIEKIPFIQLAVYNFISYFDFMFPHEKDYLCLKKILKYDDRSDFIDVGANIGLSIIGFRKMGFKNKIYAFEPNPNCHKKLLKVKKKYKNIEIIKVGLGEKNQKKNFYVPTFFGMKFHFLSTYNLVYLKNTLKDFYNFFGNFFLIEKKILSLKKFDHLRYSIKPSFIKIDVEGNDHLVVLGMMKLIKKYKPILLIEFNSENILELISILNKYYNFYFYNYKKNLLEKQNYLNILNLKKKYTRKSDLFFPRNIFFIKKAK